MNIAADENKIAKLLDRRVAPDGFFPSRDEIKKRLLSGQKLSFYYGIDPTGRDLHLGHLVQLLLLKGLAGLGHKITLLVGDFTARVGDPSGKDKSRKALSEEEIKYNMQNYIEQAEKILAIGSFDVRYNSQWLSKMKLEDVLFLTEQATVQQMIAREMFQQRIKQEKPISISEFVYPLMQGYDSVAMKIDGEIGGHDQIFNMLVGRDLVKKYLNKDKIVLATKLITGPEGKKMSKSEGEIIAFNDEPSEIRRKILAVNDEVIRDIFELCTIEEENWIAGKLKELPPRELKELLADKLIEMFYGKEKIKEAHKPKEGRSTGNLAVTIKDFGFASSISEAKKLISNNAVEVNGAVKTDWSYMPQKGDRLRVGKGKFGLIK
ncbi:MAG: tyrosine--tRNA ligase [Candidatus Yanofskybacteria bacterium RIFCSPHIGHO2_12_FULL_41_9]|nr:MAG: tyrosine--tRNA ligase [Candidatus Yanofskybacteria bacterium RIFCSPHIGHO2_12_FULL_41_9]